MSIAIRRTSIANACRWLRTGSRLLTSALVVTVAASAGCNNWPFLRRDVATVPAPRLPMENPTAASLVSYLNENARRVQSLECHDLDLDCKEGSQSAGLRGQMVCQKPRNFRMSARVIGKDAVDFGSNEQEFWFWISQAKPQPYLFHCSYQDYQRNPVALPFPIQPDWIMEALGMAEYGAPEKYLVVVQPQNVELIEATTSPQGRPMRKITVFSRGATGGNAPQVRAHILQDERHQIVCAAYITEVQTDRATGAIVPRRVKIICPADKVELSMRLDDVAVNSQISGERAARLFSRPAMANVATYDLARGPEGAHGVRPVGAP
jgi:hypothetical protein